MSKEQNRRYQDLYEKYRNLQDLLLAKESEERKFKYQDSLAIVGAIMAIAPFLSEDAPLLLCFAASVGLLCVSIRSHQEWGKWRYLAAIVVIMVFTSASVNAYNKARERNLGKLKNELIAGNQPTPNNACFSKFGHGPGVMLLMGSITSYVEQFPHTIVAVDGKPRLIVDRNGKTAQINLEIYGPDEKIIAALDNDGFTIRQGSFFKFDHRDDSSLRIVDEYNEEVLNVRYLNPHALWINALLRYEGSGPVSIKGEPSGGLCTAFNGVAEIGIEEERGNRRI